MSSRSTRWLAVAWTLAILAACSIPGRSIPDVALFSFDKLAHFVLFAGFGWLWMAALPGSLRRRTAGVALAGIAFGILTEFYQGLLPFEREPDPYDALADAAGVLCAVLLFAWRGRRRRRSA